MTIQDVDPETFYSVGKGLFEKAGKLYDAFNVNVSILGGTGSMAGTDDAGKAWATSYDERVSDPGRIQPRSSRTQRHARQSGPRARHAAGPREHGRCVVGSVVGGRSGPWPCGRHWVDAAGRSAGARW